MGRLKNYGVIAIAAGFALLSAEAQETAKTPGGGDPVIFWAHYMPMVPHGHMHAHPHAEGNHDAWPLDSQHVLLKDDYKEDIRQALASGINGFQMLTFPSEAAYEAAREIRAETGQLFYVAPQWLGPRDLEKGAKNIEAFAAQHAEDPHVYRFNGKPVHFFWNPGTEKYIGPLKERLKSSGLDLLLVPTFRPGEVTASPDWLRASGWNGVQTWTHGEAKPEVVDDIVAQVKSFAPGSFYFVPGIASGYDSSNRTGQAIHVPANGLQTLVRSLKAWVGRGFRQLMLVTWNDPQESLEIPSSRNIWGHNTILHYFHGMAEKGESPFTEPQVVVSYPVECLQGDRIFFQVLGLPEAQGANAWRVKVKLSPLGSSTFTKPIELTGETKEAPNDSLVELTTAETGFLAGVAALQPKVTVEKKGNRDKEWKLLYQDVPLPPITLRYNLVQYPVPYAIDLSKMAGKTGVTLTVQDGTPLATCTVNLLDKSDPVQRLVLCEGTRSLGVFRPAETPAASPDKEPARYRNLYLKIEASSEVSLTLSLSKGLIRDLYSPYPKLVESIKNIEAAQATFPARPPGDEYRSRVARVDVEPDTVINLRCAKSPEGEELSATLTSLAQGTLSRTVTVDGKKVTISLSLTSDATEPNIDYPLAAEVTTVSRMVPLYSADEGERVLTAWAWRKSGRIDVSAPVVIRPVKATQNTTVQWIDTKGTFDTFVDGGSATSLNPFTPDDVRVASLPRYRVPYFHLDLNEGAGSRLNDRGTSQQAGRAYLEYGADKREQGLEPESGGHYQWVEKGWRGSALQLGENARIRFRSKSAPMGSETMSLWVEAIKSPGAMGQGWSRLQADPFSLTLQTGGAMTVRFSRGGAVAEKQFPADLKEGWNHLAFVYDLNTVRFYLNSTEIGSVDGVKPVYQRSHQTPAICFSGSPADVLSFSGKLDEVQIIGTGLDATTVQELAGGAIWRNAEN